MTLNGRLSRLFAEPTNLDELVKSYSNYRGNTAIQQLMKPNRRLSWLFTKPTNLADHLQRRCIRLFFLKITGKTGTLLPADIPGVIFGAEFYRG